MKVDLMRLFHDERFAVTGWALVLAALLVLGLGGGAVALGQDSTSFADKSQEVGITKPYAETPMSFKYQGVVKDVLVKEGDRVTAGQPMIRQENREDQIELEADQDLAKSTAAVDSARAALMGRKADLVAKQAELEAKTLEYERVKKILEDGAGNKSEVEKAKYEMAAAAAEVDAANGMIDSAQADIKKADADQGQADYKAKHQQAHLDMMVLKAPTDAVVQSVNVEPGETVDPNSGKGGCITLVRIDIVQVEFFLPALQAQKLAKGQKLNVSYDQKDWEEATVQYVAPVASAPANGRETIHMDLPNPKMKAAGQVIFIKLPADIVAMRPEHGISDQ